MAWHGKARRATRASAKAPLVPPRPPSPPLTPLNSSRTGAPLLLPGEKCRANLQLACAQTNSPLGAYYQGLHLLHLETRG
jgi:hypothetical protein